MMYYSYINLKYKCINVVNLRFYRLLLNTLCYKFDFLLAANSTFAEATEEELELITYTAVHLTEHCHFVACNFVE